MYCNHNYSMKLKKRKYIDNRNWEEYNEELVFRGEVLINPVFLQDWNKEIKGSLKNKLPYFD